MLKRQSDQKNLEESRGAIKRLEVSKNHLKEGLDVALSQLALRESTINELHNSYELLQSDNESYVNDLANCRRELVDARKINIDLTGRLTEGLDRDRVSSTRITELQGIVHELKVYYITINFHHFLLFLR